MRTLFPRLCLISALFIAPNLSAELRYIFLGNYDCPVEMSARQRSVTAQVETNGAVTRGPGQGVSISLNDRRGVRVTSVEVLVHGLSPKPRAVLASGAPSPDLTRAFHLAAASAGRFTSDLWMPGASSISWIELKSLTYSDGSVWQQSSTAKCSVAPDPMVLISSAK